MLIVTLCLKLVVPVGFMPQLSDDGIELVICDGMAVDSTHAAMHGPHGHHHHHGNEGPTKPDAPCPFAGLNAPAMGGADPVLLAIALATILIAGIIDAAAVRLQAVGYLRPPLRGPPLTA